MGVERCLGCGYVLRGLPEARCPECGRAFDPDDPSTFSTKPLFVRWKFWMPAFFLAGGGGLLLYLALLEIAGWGVALTLVTPFCLGAVIGYGFRSRPFVLALLAIAVLFGIVLALYSLSLVGVFCGTAAAIVAFLPILIGTLCGFVLRKLLQTSNFEQRGYLPAILFLSVPLLWGIVERTTGQPRAIESVVTSAEIPAPVGEAWNAMMLYEEVRQRPPWLLRYGLPRPMYAHGSTARVGDIKVCVYTKGHLTKRISRRVPGELLAFDVIEQDRIETRSVRLTTGSFAFVPETPDRTRVALTTSYQPKLGPRWAWRPFERLAVHSLHQYVLDGMRLRVIELRDRTPSQ